MMTKKHFNALASAFRETSCSSSREPRDLWAELRDKIADICIVSNPNFDRSRFVDACDDKDHK